MAGRPLLRKLSREIAERGGDSVIMEKIRDGQTMGSIAAEFGVSRPMIYQWIHKGGEEREKAWELAKKLSGESLVEDGMRILDDLAEEDRVMPPETSEVTLAKARSEYRRWLASVRNRDEFGKKGGDVNVQVNLHDMHLDALRNKGRMAIPEAEYDEVESRDAELLEGEAE